MNYLSEKLLENLKKARTLIGGSFKNAQDFAQIFGVYPEDNYKKARMGRLAVMSGAYLTVPASAYPYNPRLGFTCQ